MTLATSSPRDPEGAMSELIVPPTLGALVAAFTCCFRARSYRTFQWLILGWVQCQERRTLTWVALASGAIGTYMGGVPASGSASAKGLIVSLPMARN